jgi:hypothetical protein
MANKALPHRGPTPATFAKTPEPEAVLSESSSRTKS